MATKQASKAQREWMSVISDWASENLDVLYGEEWSGSQYQLHHVLGRSAKNNKTPIGHWFIIPVPIALHDISSNHLLNVTYHKKSFVRAFGKQKEIFCEMINKMGECGYKTPNMDILIAIGETDA